MICKEVYLQLPQLLSSLLLEAFDIAFNGCPLSVGPMSQGFCSRGMEKTVPFLSRQIGSNVHKRRNRLLTSVLPPLPYHVQLPSAPARVLHGLPAVWPTTNVAMSATCCFTGDLLTGCKCYLGSL